ncbi:MAG: hypothetical protein OXC26_24930 [Albidovulum sp.]|nr:hypothetical protein [Albidovulum sp.]
MSLKVIQQAPLRRGRPSGTEWDGYCDLYGRKQAIRIRRTIKCVKTETRSEETTCCLTSLDRAGADSSMLLRIVRDLAH